MQNLIPACIWWYMNMIYDICHISWLEIDCMSGKAVHRLVKYSPRRYMTALSRYWGRSHNRPWEYDGISLVEMQCVEIVGFCFCHPLSTLGHSPHDAKQLKSVAGYTAINLVPGQAPPVWSRVGLECYGVTDSMSRKPRIRMIQPEIAMVGEGKQRETTIY
jgi:hypothetical protein